MTVTSVVRPLPGPGLVARSGDLMLVCAEGTEATRAEVAQLLGLVPAVATAGGDGAVLVRRVAALLAADLDGHFPDCAACGPVADGRLAVLVWGTATARVVGGGGEVALSAADAVTSVSRLVPGPISSIRLELPGAGPASHFARLEGGVVSAAGFVAGAEAPGEAGEVPPAPAPTVQPDEPAHPATPVESSDVVSSLIPGQSQAPAWAAPAPEPPAMDPPAWASPSPVAAPSEAVASPAIAQPPAFAPDSSSEAAEPAPPAPSWAALSATDAPAVPAPSAPVGEPPQPTPHASPAEPDQPAPHASPAEPDQPTPHAWPEEPDQPAPHASPAEPDQATPPLPVREPLSEPAGPDPRPTVLGLACPLGHLNDPSLAVCAVCGSPLPTQPPMLREGPRPPLGILTFDDGSQHLLDLGYVLGREPQHDPEVVAGGARALKIVDAEGVVSRRHLRVALVGWDIQIIDLGSANGTYVQHPDDPHLHKLEPHHAVVVKIGTRVTMGRRSFRIDPAPADQRG